MALYLFLILLVFHFDRATTITSCGDPQGISGGTRTYDSFDIGGVVTYSCKPCYTLLGRKNITCLVGRRWSHPPPSCVAVSCPAIKLDNRTLPSKTFGGSHKFVCSYSNVMVGSSEITCLCNGTWSDTPPICIPKTATTKAPYNVSTTTTPLVGVTWCPFPAEIENGIMYFITDGPGIVSDLFLPGAVIKYACPNGFHMIGQSNRVCQPNGEWATDAPICKTDALFCPEPPILKHGLYVGTNKVGDTLRIDCDEAYDIKGKRKVTCKRTGKYSDTLPKCVAKCDKIKCQDFEECLYDKNLQKALCKCKSPFRCPYNYQPICASDAKSYSNECIMKVRTCAAGKVRRKVANGNCKTGLSCQTIPRDKCRARITVFYYNKEKRNCEKIGGCTGRGFLGYESLEECKEECDGLCSRKAEKGPCDLRQTRWTYNNTTNQCETFVYGGCYGTSNMFLKREDCERFCVQEKQ